MLASQEAWAQHGFDMDAHWDYPALVSMLSGLLLASTRMKKPSGYQHRLLLQASACLTTFPCAPIPALGALLLAPPCMDPLEYRAIGQPFLLVSRTCNGP